MKKTLNNTPSTELSIYIDNLRNYLNLINEDFCKISSSYTMPIYMTSTKEIALDNIHIFHLSEIKAIEESKNEKEIYLYKINLKENTPILYYSNIVFYDNFNQTLPLGMDLSDEVLVNINKCKLKENGIENFKINYLLDEYTNKVINVKCCKLDVS